MKSWQIILIAAVLATIVVIGGTVAYVEINAPSVLRISTTTSLYDTGLLSAIKTQYEASHKVTLEITEQGTGLALNSASAGDADVVLVHSPSQEYPYLANGTLVCRKIIAWNYFTIAGPASDPAKITGENATQALKSVLAYGRASGTVAWVSRNDSSGTFTKEVSLWKAAGYAQSVISKEKSWYWSTGSGMGATLTVADQKDAYTLSDMGTYLQLKHEGSISLKALITGPDKSLINVYSVYAVNPQKISKVNYDQAITFIEWLVSPAGQTVINTYGTGNYSQPLFYGAVQAFEYPSHFQPDVSWIQSYAFFNGTECPPQYRDNQAQNPLLYP